MCFNSLTPVFFLAFTVLRCVFIFPCFCLHFNRPMMLLQPLLSALSLLNMRSPRPSPMFRASFTRLPIMASGVRRILTNMKPWLYPSSLLLPQGFQQIRRLPRMMQLLPPSGKSCLAVLGSLRRTTSPSSPTKSIPRSWILSPRLTKHSRVRLLQLISAQAPLVSRLVVMNVV